MQTENLVFFVLRKISLSFCQIGLEDSDYGKDKILFPTRAPFGGKKLKFLRIKLAGSLLDSGREKTCRKYHPFTKMSRKCISKALYRTFDKFQNQ